MRAAEGSVSAGRGDMDVGPRDTPAAPNLDEQTIEAVNQGARMVL